MKNKIVLFIVAFQCIALAPKAQELKLSSRRYGNQMMNFSKAQFRSRNLPAGISGRQGKCLKIFRGLNFRTSEGIGMKSRNARGHQNFDVPVGACYGISINNRKDFLETGVEYTMVVNQQAKLRMFDPQLSWRHSVRDYQVRLTVIPAYWFLGASGNPGPWLGFSINKKF